MTETLPHRNDEITLLDLAVAVAESWVLLVFGPLLVGLAVFGFLHFGEPDNYRSEAIVQMSQDESALLQSARVLDPAIQESGWGTRFENVAAARQTLQENGLRVEKLNDIDYFRISVNGTSAETAQALLTSLIDQLIANSAPRGAERVVLEQKLATLTRSVENLNANLDSLNAIYNHAADGNWAAIAMLNNAEQSSAALIENIATAEQEILSTQIALEGSVSQADIIQEPTLAGEPQPRRTLLIAVVAAIAAGFVLLLFAFVRAGLKNAAQNAESADKMRRIKSAFSFGKSR